MYLIHDLTEYFLRGVIVLEYFRLAVVAGAMGCGVVLSLQSYAQDLERELSSVPVESLVEEARVRGDAARGAVVFYQASSACSKCHATDLELPSLLGPHLAQKDPRFSDVAIIEAILDPSKSIRPGFESAQILTTAGQVITGLVVEQNDQHITIRDANGVQTATQTAKIDDFKISRESLMPRGQVNQLTSRQQFLDLVRFLFEIRDGGPQRALALKPHASLLDVRLPEYERDIDHAGFVGDWGTDSLERGEAIYRRVCANCHGTKDQLGSLPTSLRFADGIFKNGSDPWSIYRTLTHGFGFMPAQTWMVPSQKYDVIHYIRESYLKRYNRSQLTRVDAAYLESLPKGNSRGPEPSSIEAWNAMDYGPFLTHCYETPGAALNIAYKGMAIRLDSGAGGVARGNQWMIFDTDTMRVSAGWHAKEDSGNQNFIDWRDIQFNGEHGVHPKIVGQVVFANGNGAGWANPANSTFDDDSRIAGRDGRRYGPLPKNWAQFHGSYHYSDNLVLSYSIGRVNVLELLGELPSNETFPAAFTRTFNVGPREHDLVLKIADSAGEKILAEASDDDTSSIATNQLAMGTIPSIAEQTWSDSENRITLKIPKGNQPLRFTLWISPASANSFDKEQFTVIAQHRLAQTANRSVDLERLTNGGPLRWPQTLETQVTTSTESEAFAIDTLVAPVDNPWLAQLRFTGLDFFQDGSIAACTWDGDVWRIQIAAEQGKLTWKRIATGLFQPLGLKIVDNKVHLTCRDQLAVLHDLNGDGESDFIECLNNDHQVTEHFHEFAMGLQVDAAGNFYYAKSGRHALPAVVPHHGTLLRIDRDGQNTDILATGFRAANGVCINPDGSFIVTDQEGFWNPKNRINWVTLAVDDKPKFYGNMFGYHDVQDTSDSAMEPPLCWITNKFDRSPGELLWVRSKKWGALDGSLLNLSYGTGKVFVVLHEDTGGIRQGGMVELPIPAFATGIMRGRFHPQDDELYVCGMFSWAGDATSPGGLHRIRATGKPACVPTELHAIRTGLVVKFDEAIAPESVEPSKFTVRVWSLRRTEEYGSQHYAERELAVKSADIQSDGKTVQLEVEGIVPTWCMEIRYSLISISGKSVSGSIHNTIHNLGE